MRLGKLTPQTVRLLRLLREVFGVVYKIKVPPPTPALSHGPFFSLTLEKGPRRPVRLELSDTKLSPVCSHAKKTLLPPRRRTARQRRWCSLAWASGTATWPRASHRRPREREGREREREGERKIAIERERERKRERERELHAHHPHHEDSAFLWDSHVLTRQSDSA